MELNREQIIKALECCQEPTVENCAKCPYIDVPRIKGRDCLSKCYEDIVALINSQEQRIKELITENKQFRYEQRKLIEENEKLRTVIFKKEDTMQIILQEHQAEYDSMAKSVNEASELIRKLRANKEKLINAYKKLLDEHQKTLSHYFIDTTIGSGTSRQKCIEETVRKMAKMLQDEIKSALDSNYRARQERIDKWKDPNAYIGGDFVSICDGKIAALRGIDDFIDEIVDKMLEGK